jgi:hypothetical protein
VATQSLTWRNRSMPAYLPGQKVVIEGHFIGMALVTNIATVVCEDERYEGYYIVHVDPPALHITPEGIVEEHHRLVVAWDNIRLAIEQPTKEKQDG